MAKTHVKVGDKVVVTTGAKDIKGVTGEVTSVNSKKQTVTVEGVKDIKKTVRASEQSEGGILDMPRPIHISNVKKVD